MTLFSRPPFYAVLLAPLSRLPYRSAYAVWVLVQVLSLAGCWIWALRRFGNSAAAYTCLYLPPMVGICLGQDPVFPLLIVVAAYALAERRKEFLSGVVLGLGLFKFHLFVLWPLAALAQRRWKLLTGLLLTSVVELATSLYVAGSAGLANYVRILGGWNVAALHPAPEKVISLWGVAASLGIRGIAIAAVFAVLCAVFLIFAIRRADLRQLFTVATAGSVAIVPHVYLYDATVLLLPLWLAIFKCRDEIVRNAGIAIAKPFLFAALLIFGPPFTACAGIAVVGFALIAARSSAAQWAISERSCQLKVGEIIWRTHGIPRVDPFAFTTHGHAWIAHEWLAQLTIYGAWKFGGYTGGASALAKNYPFLLV